MKPNADTARLDWLLDRSSATFRRGVWAKDRKEFAQLIYSNGVGLDCVVTKAMPTMRAAIDAAMKAEARRAGR